MSHRPVVAERDRNTPPPSRSTEAAALLPMSTPSIADLTTSFDFPEPTETHYLPGMARRRSIKKLLLPLFVQVGTTAQSLHADSAGFWRVGADRYWLPRVIFRGAKEEGEETLRLAIFAGLHGDEPAGVYALVDLLRALEADPWVGRAYRIHIYPLCNPTGYEDSTRHSRSGL